MARSRWAALAALATITLAACSGGGDKSSGGQVEDPGAAATSAKLARSFEDLSKALDIAVPEGYMLQPDEVGDTGPSDLEKAVRDDGADDARDVLTRVGFVRGYQRMWKGLESDEIVSYVYQFSGHAGAAEYTHRVTAAAEAAAPGVTIDTFTLPGIGGAVGVNAAAAASAISSVAFVKGPYSVEVVVSGSSPTGLESLATALAEEQHSRL